MPLHVRVQLQVQSGSSIRRWSIAEVTRSARIADSSIAEEAVTGGHPIYCLEIRGTCCYSRARGWVRVADWGGAAQRVIDCSQYVKVPEWGRLAGTHGRCRVQEAS